MVLTQNTIMYNGRKLYQVTRFNTHTQSGEFGGYVESRKNLPTDMENSWIKPGSYILGNTQLNGRITIDENVVIEDSVLNGRCIVRRGVRIKNSNITAKPMIVVREDCVIENKTFACRNAIEKELCDTKRFVYSVKNGINLIEADRLCKLNCFTLTYKEAWDILTKDELWYVMRDKHTETPEVFTDEIRQWLTERCAKHIR